MSGIPRDYPAGMNGFPQVIRGCCTALRELRCEICAREHPVWFAPNDIWNAAVRRPDGSDRWQFLCPTCFITIAEAMGCVTTGWLVAPEEASVVTTTRAFTTAAGDGAAEFRKDAVGPHSPERAPAPQQPAATSELLRNLIRAARCNEGIVDAADPLIERIAAIEQANGRMRSGIMEAIALLEGGSEYEKIHVLGTLRGAL